MASTGADFTPFDIDLVSENACRPTVGMRRFMSAADVGDEERGEDPTVRELEALVAELTGKAAAVFMPSGTMCNVIAFFVWCAPGDTMLLHEDTHPVYSKYAGPHIHNRLDLCKLAGERGVLTSAAIDRGLVGIAQAGGTARLLSLENTHNRSGGSIWSVAQTEEACDAAHAHGLSTHLDGARLLNAVAASGVSTVKYCAPFDSAWIDLSKGLGCPMGAVMAGDARFVAEARNAKYLFGGVTHKAGMMAAAGIYALQHHVERLAEDHERASELAAGLACISGVELAQESVDTNLVYLDIEVTGLTAEQLLVRLAVAGVRMKQIDETKLRAVTHLDITSAQVGAVVAAVEAAVAAV